MCTLESKETVIVLAGTKWQIPLVKKLKEKGYKVVVFNLLPDFHMRMLIILLIY